jgi:hypothetical protein
VVSGSHEIDRRQEARARVELKPWENRLEFTTCAATVQEMLTTLAGAAPEILVLLLPVSSDDRQLLFRRAEQWASDPGAGLRGSRTR